MTSDIGYEPLAALLALTGLQRRTALNHIRTGVIPAKKIGGSWFIPRHYLRELERESLG